jgi:hypothetical protein
MEKKSQAEEKSSQRKARLAAALRENLKRRKQARRAPASQSQPLSDKKTGQ